MIREIRQIQWISSGSGFWYALRQDLETRAIFIDVYVQIISYGINKHCITHQKLKMRDSWNEEGIHT